MPRQPDFTPEEDAILLATVGATPEETNARLEAGGFRARTGSQLKYRRYYLRTAPTPESRTDEALAREMARRRELAREQERVAQEVERIRREIEASTQRIHDLMQRYGESLAEDPPGA